MCYSDDAQVPLPPIRGAALDHTELHLEADDGNRFAAFAAHPAAPDGRGVGILPDIRGLHSFYKELAIRFAEVGFEAIAMDYFGRTADSDERDESFEFRPHVEQTKPETIAADVRACVGYLRSQPRGQSLALFSVGFCFGGANSWRQSAEDHGLAGCIGFYGGQPMTRVGPWIPKMRAPLLMLLAGDDFTPPEEFAEFADKVRAQGVEVEAHTYQGAPHSFFDRKFDEYREACDDAWWRILGFTEQRLPAPVP